MRIYYWEKTEDEKKGAENGEWEEEKAWLVRKEAEMEL
jgi:hypothetical protein